jgi:iron complex outermembrane receptor protein
MILRGKRRTLARAWLRRALACSGAAIIAFDGTAVAAQQASQPPAPQKVESGGDPASDIVVTGQRGSAVTDIEPLATYDASTIAGIGATTMEELLRVIRPAARSADGSEPIFLLNAQRVSG